ncbi:hypothetical protein [Streptomyces buecherae]|uniref:Uncharacterized protein n=1 Tax=Streptomyces buecherae TaxID=2763006 RepID=A0A7H8NFK8_9ACTN|nr:hypothetical protein [Streptomyces buecherae]QKW53232.1 hypothetical protein HUT08_30960 [Streptomyces buecherae]
MRALARDEPRQVGPFRLVGVPDGLEELAARCLAKGPAARPTLAQLAAALGPRAPYPGWLPAAVAHSLLSLASAILSAEVPPSEPGATPPAVDATPATAHTQAPPATVSPETGVPPPAFGPPPATPFPVPPQSPPPAGPDAGRRVSRRSAVIGLSAVGAGAVAGAGWLLSRDGDTGGPGGDRKAPGGGTRAPAGKPVDAENPFEVERGAPLEVVLFDGPYGHSYLSEATKLYQQAHGKTDVTTGVPRFAGDDLRDRVNDGRPPDLFDNAGAGGLDVLALVEEDQVVELSRLLDAPSYDDPKRRSATPCCRRP